MDAKSGKVFGTEDPRTGKKLTDVAEAQKEDVDAAVQAARRVSTEKASVPYLLRSQNYHLASVPPKLTQSSSWKHCPLHSLHRTQ